MELLEDGYSLDEHGLIDFDIENEDDYINIDEVLERLEQDVAIMVIKG